MNLQPYFESGADRQALLMEIQNDISSGKCKRVDIVIALDPFLTSTNDDRRLLALKLLQQLVLNPKASSLELEVLTTFFVAKLDDHFCIEVVLETLESLSGGFGPHDALRVLEEISSRVEVKLYVQAVRQLVYRLTLACISRVDSTVNDAELLATVLKIVDEEKDPRNLMLTFEIVRQVCALFPQSPMIPVNPANSKDVFEVVFSYFPIEFRPNFNTNDVVSVAELTEKYNRIFTSSNQFPPLVLQEIISRLGNERLPERMELLNLALYCIKFGSPSAVFPLLESLLAAIVSLTPNNDVVKAFSAIVESLSIYSNIHSVFSGLVKKLVVEMQSNEEIDGYTEFCSTLIRSSGSTQIQLCDETVTSILSKPSDRKFIPILSYCVEMYFAKNAVTDVVDSRKRQIFDLLVQVLPERKSPYFLFSLKALVTLCAMRCLLGSEDQDILFNWVNEYLLDWDEDILPVLKFAAWKLPVLFVEKSTPVVKKHIHTARMQEILSEICSSFDFLKLVFDDLLDSGLIDLLVLILTNLISSGSAADAVLLDSLFQRSSEFEDAFGPSSLIFALLSEEEQQKYSDNPKHISVVLNAGRPQVVCGISPQTAFSMLESDSVNLKYFSLSLGSYCNKLSTPPLSEIEALKQKKSESTAKVVACIAKGLVMKLDPAGFDLFDFLFCSTRDDSLLFDSTLQDCQYALCRRVHCTVKPLHKQKFVRWCLSRPDLSAEFNMIISAICHAPKPVLEQEVDRIYPIILRCLGGANSNAIQSSLGILVSLEIKRDSLEVIVPLMLKWAVKGTLFARIDAIKCLRKISEYPEGRKYSKKIIDGLSECRDDHKRLVRIEVQRCLHSWFLLPPQ